jgi:hypothetical protein
MLRAAAADAGWRIERMTSFNAAYLLPAAAVRAARRGAAEGGTSELTLTPPALDRVLELPLRLEAALIRHGVAIPAGLSLLALLRT